LVEIVAAIAGQLPSVLATGVGLKLALLFAL